MRKKVLALLVACALVMTMFTGCAGNSAPAEPAKPDASQAPTSENPLVLQLSHVFSKGTPMDTSVVTAAENIEKRTNGAIKIQISPKGILPNGVDGFEQCVRGANFINLYDPSAMADWVPDYVALMGPFLVDTREEFKLLCESETVKEMNKKAEEQNLKVLALPFNFGFRQISSGKIKIQSPADLKGIKFRVPGSQVFIKTFEALGANPITTPSSEVYNAIQTGLADANESSLADLAQMQMQEVVKYITLSGHFIGTSSAVMSNEVFNKLSEEQQAILIEEFQNAAEVCSQEYAEKEGEARKVFEDAGVEFVEVDKEPFKELTKVVYSQEVFPNMSPGIYEKLQEELTKIRGK
jgi:TRAP-type C4-dicarboxylate transport system substrate-binding protein